VMISAAYYPQYYVLDGYGGVHAGGGAVAFSPGSHYFGWDISKAIAYIPVGTAVAQGDGLIQLDGWGGLWYAGALASDPPTGTTPWWGWNIARDIVYRIVPPRIEYSYSDSYSDLTLSTYTNVASNYMHIPDDGFVFVTCNAELLAANATAGNNAVAEIGIGDNVTTGEAPGTSRYEVLLGGDVEYYYAGCRSVVTQRTFSVSKGSSYYFYFLVRRAAGTAPVRVIEPNITMIFVDQNWRGESGPSLSSEPGKPSHAVQPMPGLSGDASRIK
jgi:hypothetical protein